GRIQKDEFTQTTYLKKIEDRVIELNKFEVGAKESTSHFKVLKRDGGFTLLEGQLSSGRTHQLRVQLSALGNPIVGDIKYGSKIRSKRMMLHSYYLEIPKLGIKLELPLPDSFLLKKNLKIKKILKEEGHLWCKL
ncbi:MAG: pseudouridine synthase, partial [Fusobacteriaceae bacterium]